MKALIIGAAGFVGRHLITHLKTLKWEVYTTKLPNEKLNEDVQVYDLDILDQSAIQSLLDKIKPDYIFHLAAQSSVAMSWTQPALTVDVNIKGTVNLLEAIRNRHYPALRLLLIGSGDEYGYITKEDLPIKEDTLLRPGNIYACTKAAQNMLGQAYSRAYNLEIVMVRAFNHTGPGQLENFAVSNFCRQIAEIEAGKIPPVIKVGNLTSLRDFTDVRDIVKAYSLLIQKGKSGLIYNVGSGKSISMQEVLNLVLSMSKVNIKVEQDPSLMRVSDTPVIQADITRLTNETGWKPEISLETTIADMIEYWRSTAGTHCGGDCQVIIIE